MGVQKIGPDGKPVIDPSSGNPIVEEKTLTENGASISKALGKLQAQERLNTLASYAAKFALQAGWLDWARTSEWWETMPVVEDLLHYTGNYLNYEQFSQNLCNDLVYDIKDNDEGAIFQPGGLSVPIVVGTFGSEVLPVQNASKGYLYITATLVVNPTRQDQLGMKKGDYDYKLRVVLKDLQECDSECEPSVDLTNGAWFNLSAGNTFGNGNMPKTRIDHLQGRYGKLCVEFDKPFPDPKAATSKKSYCRTINVNTFERGTSVVPPTTGGSRGGTGGTGGTSGTGGTGPTGPDPLGGWQ
jgi:hypothetical protein